jgi:hypothetical protein
VPDSDPVDVADVVQRLQLPDGCVEVPYDRLPTPWDAWLHAVLDAAAQAGLQIAVFESPSYLVLVDIEA